MSNFFKVKEHGSTVRTEIMAGVTTFMAMAYILMVNAGMFSSLGTVSYGAIYIATAISAVIGTVLIGLLSNLPLAQASGMGLNAFFVYTVCFTFGLSYANALVLVLVDGIVFVLLTVTGLRKMIFDAIPAAVKTAMMVRSIGKMLAHVAEPEKTLKEERLTSVAPSSTTIPAFCRPMNAMNRPMPTETPFLSVSGMALKIASRTLVSDRTIKIRPSMNTASSATCQE